VSRGDVDGAREVVVVFPAEGKDVVCAIVVKKCVTGVIHTFDFERFALCDGNHRGKSMCHRVWIDFWVSGFPCGSTEITVRILELRRFVFGLLVSLNKVLAWLKRIFDEESM